MPDRRIDDEEAFRPLRAAFILIAHNAAFDRPWIERRLQDIDGFPWPCSTSQIDWRSYGFDGTALGYLFYQA
ncbi:hypothetical protein IFT82_16175 [Sphingomonas sp. CFBP 8760]|nr:hypothetical protein [Sphingomonas sp. CFBP 8760]